jgi:hypothetical protein
MSTERPEFRPIESTPPTKRAWPFVVIGALLVAVLLFAVRRDVTAGAVRTASLTDASLKADVSKVVAAPAPPAPAKVVAESPKADPTLLPQRAPEGPNVLGTAGSAAKSLAMVAKSELDREIARTKGAQKEAAAYRKQIEDLNKQLADARAQLAAVQRAKMPPPPSDQEQILQMLAPVLRSSNDARN